MQLITSEFPRTVLAVLLVATLATPAPAQTPSGSSGSPSRTEQAVDAVAQAHRLAEGGDTTAALRVLRDATEKDRDNAPLWHAYGSLLAAKTQRVWRTAVMPSGYPSLMIAAESSLARAMILSPDSVNYAIDYGRYLWNTSSNNLSHAVRVQQSSLEHLPDSSTATIGSVADQVGIMLWRSYEPLVARGIPWTIGRGPGRVTQAGLVAWVKDNYKVPPVPFGEGIYNEALRYLRLARESDPDNELYLRHEMMVLAERQRWPEMESIARHRVSERPNQPWPWLVLGLSEHRQGRTAAGQAAFDSGYARLPVADRERLTTIQRLLPSRQARWYDTLSVAAKAQLHEVFWNTANPSLLLPTNPMFAEFRARVVFSEMSFTDDEKHRPGANSDKGDVYTRFGPPEFVTDQGLCPEGMVPHTWIYAVQVMMFTFCQASGYGTAFLGLESHESFDSLSADRPSTWGNLPVMRNRIDSVSVQVARFRGPADSIDVAVFAGIRSGALRRNAPVDSSVIRHGVFLVDALGRAVTRSTGSFTSGERDSTTLRAQNYFVRTTAAARAVRVEALEPDLMQSARTMADISGFESGGFGVSDLLIAAAVEPRGTTTGARWSDFAIAALTGGMVPRDAPLSLLWESYEAGSVNGSAHLRYAVSVERETNKGLVAMAAKVVGGLRNAVARTRTSDRFTITYDRDAGAAPVLADYLQLDLGALDPGRYRVSLAVTDVVRNVTMTRMQWFVIVQR